MSRPEKVTNEFHQQACLLATSRMAPGGSSTGCGTAMTVHKNSSGQLVVTVTGESISDRASRFILSGNESRVAFQWVGNEIEYSCYYLTAVLPHNGTNDDLKVTPGNCNDTDKRFELEKHEADCYIKCCLNNQYLSCTEDGKVTFVQKKDARCKFQLKRLKTEKASGKESWKPEKGSIYEGEECIIEVRMDRD